MFKQKHYSCPVCKSYLGTFDKTSLIVVTCTGDSCGVKWCFKPEDKLPTALSFPGMKLPKKCTCNNCTK